MRTKREGEVPHVVGEYTALRLKQPLPIPGKPHTVGVWVKGDSSWGQMKPVKGNIRLKDVSVIGDGK